MLHPTTMQRLAFIRYLYDRAVEQSRHPQPLCAASILTFHDCMELWLQLAAELVGIAGGKSISFMAYWQPINGKLQAQHKGPIGYDAQMKRLTDARADFKHHGTFPAPMTIEMARAAVTGFLEDSTPIVFGIAFNSISMVNLVVCAAGRAGLEEANRLLEAGELYECLCKIAIAFAEIMADYTEKTPNKFGDRPPFFDPPIRGGIREFRVIDKMLDSIRALEEAVKVMSGNLDYRRYTKFRLITPTVVGYIGGEFETRGPCGIEPLTVEACRFCFDFVIDSAIRLQEHDFDVQP